MQPNAIILLLLTAVLLSGCTAESREKPFTIDFTNTGDHPVRVAIWDEVPAAAILEDDNVQPSYSVDKQMPNYNVTDTKWFRIWVHDSSMAEAVEQEGELVLEDDTLFVQWNGSEIRVYF